MTTKILIVDDQLLFAESLQMVLQGLEKDFKVIAIAHNGQEAIKIVDSNHPNIILMDVRMPVLDGVAATKILHEKYPQIPILMLTTFEDDDYVREALKYGARGYVLKNVPSQELVHSIKAVLGGLFLIDPRVLHAVMAKSPEQNQEIAPELDLPILSRKEKQLLSLIAHGFHNDEIASQLHLANQSVRNSISKLYKKLECNHRQDALIWAKKLQIL